MAEFEIEQFATALVESMPDAVIFADRNGTIVWWNHGATVMFGYSREAALGRTLDIIIPENLRARHWEGYHHTMETGESRYGAQDLLAVPAIRQDGSRLSVEFTIVPFKDSSGRMMGIAAVMRDVTRQFAEARSLRKKLAQYVAAEKAAAPNLDSSSVNPGEEDGLWPR